VALKSVVVVGAGMVGAACALRLQAAGLRVVLIDVGDKRRGASFGNAGHIAVEQVAPWASWSNFAAFPARLFGVGGALDFRWRDVGLWAPWSLRFLAACNHFARGQAALGALLERALPAWQRLVALAGRPDVVRTSGHAVVWMTPQAADAGREAWGKAQTGPATVRDMTTAEAASYASVMHRPPSAGIVFGGTAKLSDPQVAREVLLEAFVKRGGELVNSRVTRVSVMEQALVHVDDGPARVADAALICAGAWSRALMADHNVKAPLIGERGYSIQSTGHDWPENLFSTAFEEHSMFVTRFTTGLRATSFLEFGSPGAPPDSRKWERLKQNLRRLGIRFGEALDCWVGARPTLPDYLPAIGRLAQSPRILYAFGHQHLGITLAAVTAEFVEALVGAAALPFDPAPYRIERFQG